MVHLTGLREDEIAQVAQIAESNQIPKKFLDQIFADLRRAGLVYSRKGKAGGYALAKPASEIRMGQIIRAIDGPIAPVLCASPSAYRPAPIVTKSFARFVGSRSKPGTRYRVCSIHGRLRTCGLGPM